MAATRSDYWCSKRFRDGSISATRPGRMSPSATSARWSAATGTIRPSFSGACASMNRTINDAFYTRTNALAHELDDARQTAGVRYLYDSHLLEDVFTMNDFGFPLKKPNHPLYLN